MVYITINWPMPWWFVLVLKRMKCHNKQTTDRIELCSDLCSRPDSEG